MHVKKHLGFSGLRKTISKRLLQIEDFQKGEVEYTLHDCFMSAFAMMFFEHNFGHGKKNLSMMFFLLNLLAFFTHQILELTDVLYQKCRATFSSRREYWNQLRCTFRIMLFKSWQHMLSHILDPPEVQPP